MSHSDKVEVMDLLINVIKDHEKNLDSLLSRAETLMEDDNLPQNLLQNPPNLRLLLKNWDEFCKRAVEAELVCFDIFDKKFFCNAITDTKIYVYCEDTPKTVVETKNNDNDLINSSVKVGKQVDNKISFHQRSLSIGLELKTSIFESGELKKVEYELDHQYTKNWLSKKLGIHRDFIVRGYIDS
jgi:hypothetical protein